MTPFLRALYAFLKLLIRTSFAILHPRTRIEGEEHLHFDGAGIVVSNHPNTMIDPLMAASRTGHQVFFLANASLFKHPVMNYLLNRLYCIPIQRPKDVQGGQMRNEASFQRCFQHLARGGTIYIAPEGGSDLERRLRPIKTGTARIALGAEDRQEWQLGLRIVPVGLNYESPTTCFSRLFIRVGEPILIPDWAERFAAGPIVATRQLTAELEERMKALLVQTRDKNEERTLRRLERSVQNDEPLAVDAHHYRTQEILQSLREMEPEQYGHLRESSRAYDCELRERGISDLAFSRHPRRRPDLVTLLGWPVFLYGFLNHFLILYLPHWAFRATGIYRGYGTDFKFGATLLLLPLCYWLQSELAEAWLGTAASWWYLLSLPVTAYLAWRYHELSRAFRARLWARLRLSKQKRQQLRYRRSEMMKLARTEIATG